MTMNKLKGKAFKKFTVRRQVSYLHNNLGTSLAVDIQSCSTYLIKMNNYLRLLPGPDSNEALGKGYLIDILTCLVPTAWRESMIFTNFEPMYHTILEAVEYYRQVEVIEST